MTFHNIRQLRPLELIADWPSSLHQVLSSITSTELRKIIFRGVFNQQAEVWALIENRLCGLVDQLRARGYRHTLEAELRLIIRVGDLGMYDFTTIFPEFREKGVVTIIDAARGDGWFLHSSTLNH